MSATIVVYPCCNRRYRHAFDCNRGFVIGDRVRDLFTPEHRTGIIRAFGNRADTNERFATISNGAREHYRVLDKIEKVTL